MTKLHKYFKNLKEIIKSREFKTILIRISLNILLITLLTVLFWIIFIAYVRSMIMNPYLLPYIIKAMNNSDDFVFNFAKTNVSFIVTEFK